MSNEIIPSGEFLLYSSEDGKVRLEVRMQDETLWLTQKEMALLFDVDIRTISYHLKNIFQTNELQGVSVVQKNWITAADGKNYEVTMYNLDAIISVGYRVNSIRGTQFRIWATQRLREYIIKGFTLDDERLKNNGNPLYFEKLLEQIRDIRSSEKVFWRKILDIYATSIDYSSKSEVTQRFFKIIQNKMHWAAHGHTAAEIIHERADSTQPNMGLTNWVGASITKQEAEVAKNYLSEEEINYLNRIVTAYLEFAELQAMGRKTMTMQNWIDKLDDFLKLSGREILTHAGKISTEQAKQKVHHEFDLYKQTRLNEPSQVERDFNASIEELKSIENRVKKRKDKS